jgi:hypothetical protein
VPSAIADARLRYSVVICAGGVSMYHLRNQKPRSVTLRKTVSRPSTVQMSIYRHFET